MPLPENGRRTEEQAMSMEQICILITILVYLAGMLYIGFYCTKKGGSGNTGEFYLGGRQLGQLVTAMSAEASDMSSWLLMGMPGVAYLTGVADAAWTAIGLAIGTYLNWLIVAKRLRRYSVKTDSITIPDFFSRRYHDKKNILSCIAAIVILIFFVPYTASGFKAVGTLFNSLFGLEYHAAMLLGAAVVVGYTIMGGFLAVSTTDLIQSIVMSISLIVVVFFGISYAGGWGAVVDNAKSMSGYLSMTHLYHAGEQTTSSYGFLSIASTLAWGLGYFGMPHILLRFMAIRKERELKTSRRIGSIWVVISMGVAILIGVIGNAVSAAGKIELLGTSSEAETIIIRLSNIMGQNGVLLALLAGVIMAGILACTMSTADSQLLAAASSVSQNLLQDFAGIKMKEKTAMLIARLTVLGIAVISILLAWNPNSSVFKIVSFAWAGFGAAFGPVVLFALFWKRSNKWGALAGILSGGIMVFVWKFLVRPLGGAWDLYELLPAFLVASMMILVVSLATGKPDAEIEREFEEVKQGK